MKTFQSELTFQSNTLSVNQMFNNDRFHFYKFQAQEDGIYAFKVSSICNCFGFDKKIGKLKVALMAKDKIIKFYPDWTTNDDFKGYFTEFKIKLKKNSVLRFIIAINSAVIDQVVAEGITYAGVLPIPYKIKGTPFGEYLVEIKKN